MSRGDSGVAYMAWNVRCQFSPPMIGNVASNAADCIDGRNEQSRREELQVGQPAERRAGRPST